MVGRSLEKNQAPATYVPWVMLGKQVNLANSADPAMANSAPSHGWSSGEAKRLLMLFHSLVIFIPGG